MRSLFISLLLSSVIISAIAQEPLTHQYKVYQTDKGKMYYNKNLPVYLWLGTSENPNDKNKTRLKSESSPQYSNPFYWDTEGINTVRTPSKVDTVTKKAVQPKQEIIFEVYSDDLSPISSIKMTGANSFYKNKMRYYGAAISAEISSKDAVSGVEKIYYSLNGSKYTPYANALDISKEGENVIKYYAVDYVGNAEKPKEKKLVMDKTAPVTKKSVDGTLYKKVFSNNVKITLTAEDDLSGVKYIFYSFDGQGFKVYSKPLTLWHLKDGEHKLVYYAKDNVGNEEDKTQMSNSLMFYLDITAPAMQKLEVINEEEEKVLRENKDEEMIRAYAVIMGDQYQGNYRYVSERTKIKILTSDNKAGLKKVEYGISEKVSTNTYAQPFALKDKTGVQTINFRAIDKVDNVSEVRSFPVYFDKTAPATGITYQQPQFFDRDTLFINAKTLIKLFSNDNASGVQSTEYSINEGEFKPYTEEFALPSEGSYVLKFKSIDNVNNQETVKESKVFVDDNAPKIYINFSIEPIGEKKIQGKMYNVYPTYAGLYIGATDRYCGTESIKYSIDDAPMRNYVTDQKKLAEQQVFKKEKLYKVKVEAKDKLGNTSEKEIEFYVGEKGDE